MKSKEEVKEILDGFQIALDNYLALINPDDVDGLFMEFFSKGMFHRLMYCDYAIEDIVNFWKENNPLSRLYFACNSKGIVTSEFIEAVKDYIKSRKDNL